MACETLQRMRSGTDSHATRRPRAILFDLDGVLIESYEVWFRLLRAGAEHFGARAIDRPAFDDMWGQGVDADAAVLGCSVTEAERFFVDHFADFTSALEIDPAAATVLAHYRSLGTPTALVTNTPTPLAAQILSATELGVDRIIGGTDVPAPKPAPDIPLAACEALAIRPEDALMIGDSSFDQRAAARAKIFFVGLRIDGDRRIESLADLPSQDHLPQEWETPSPQAETAS